MSRDERGQVVPLTLGLFLLTLAIAGLAVDGTRAFLYRRTLQNAADSAALAGASAIARDDYYRSGGSTVALAPGAARSAALEWVARRGLRVAAEVAVDREAVTVILRGAIPTSFLRSIGVERMRVAVEARAGPVAGEVP